MKMCLIGRVDHPKKVTPLSPEYWAEGGKKSEQMLLSLIDTYSPDFDIFIRPVSGSIQAKLRQHMHALQACIGAITLISVHSGVQLVF